MTSRQPDNKTLHKAVFLSLLLHVLVLVFFAKYKVSPQETVDTANKPVKESIQVVLVKRHISAPPVTKPPLNEELAPSKSSNKAESVDSTPDSSESVMPSPTIPPSDEQPSTSQSTAFSDRPLPGTSEESDSPLRVSASQVKSLISNYMESYNEELTRQGIEECLIYQNQHGAKDCPEFQLSNNPGKTAANSIFEDITRDSDHQILVRKFARENQQLASIISSDSAASQLAQIRYTLNWETMEYLQEHFVGDSAGASRVCSPMPCVYRYSEFEIKQPERPLDENAFKLKTLWFNSPR